MAQNRVYKMAIEELNNNAYDMQEEYTNEEIAELVKQIVAELNKSATDCVEVNYLGNQIKVRNTLHWSFVSYSTGDYTGLSESVAEITDLSRPIEEYEIKNLIEMINEAWYQAVA